MAELKDFERLREETQAKIIQLFREAIALEETIPDEDKSPYMKIMTDIADQVGYTYMGVRRLLIRKGEYTPFKRKNKRRRKITVRKRKNKC